MMEDKLYTIKQAASICHVGQATIRLAIRDGEMRAWKFPSEDALLVKRVDLLAWAVSRATMQEGGYDADEQESAR